MDDFYELKNWILSELRKVEQYRKETTDKTQAAYVAGFARGLNRVYNHMEKNAKDAGEL